MKKKIVIIAAIVLALAAGLYLWLTSRAGDKADAPQWSYAAVEKGDIRVTVACSGRVVSNLDVEIKCKASGEVVKLPFDVSDPVKKGELLVELDPIDEQRRVNQEKIALTSAQARLMQSRVNLQVAERELVSERKSAEAALKSAQAQEADARAKAGRAEQLFEKKFTSQEDLDTSQTTAVQAQVALENARIRIDQLKTKERELEVLRQDIQLAEAEVENGRINLSIAEQRLEDTKVFSPIDGVVSERNVQIGQIISSGISNVGGGTLAMMLSDLSRIFILASVDESDVGRVTLGQKAVITADAFSGKRFAGKVDRIATKGTNVSNVVTFEVKIEVLEPEKSMLKPEMTANVEIIAAEKIQTLIVPVEAVGFNEQGGFVWVKKQDNSLEQRKVVSGISDGMMTEILEGLNPGETIAYRKGDAASRWRKDADASSGRGMRMIMGGPGR